METRIDLSESQASIALTPDGSKLLASLPSANAVWVIDAGSYAIIKEIDLDEPAYIMISGDGSYAYVTSFSTDNPNYISQISLDTLTEIRSFREWDYPIGIVENPISGDLLVSNRFPNEPQGNILVLDSSFVAQDTIDVDGLPTAMVFSQDGTNLWVTVAIKWWR